MVQIALLGSAVICFLLGLIVLLNNSRSNLFRVYFSVSVVSALWMIVNGLVVEGSIGVSSNFLLFFSRLITPLSLLTTLNFMYFLMLYRNVKLIPQSWWLVIPTVSVSAFSFTSLNVYLNNQQQAETGILYPVYLMALLFNVCLVFVALYKKPRSKNALRLDLQHTAQLRYITVGTYLTFVPAITFGAILPLFSATSWSNIGPLFSILFLIAAGLAIVKHQLFDVRLVAARSMAYTLSLGALGLAFVVATNLATTFFTNDEDVGGTLRAVYAVLAVILALAFPPIKSFFDRATNRIFFRDSYDSQLFLDKFNKLLVSTYEFKSLLHKCAGAIEDTLRPTFCAFSIHATASTSRKFVGSDKLPAITKADLDTIQQIVSHVRTTVILTDDLSERYADLHKVLKANNIVVVARLAANHSSEAGAGCILLGPKKSGNSYSSQDLRLIGIIANELVIAVQNSLRFEEIENFNLTLQAKIAEATRKLRSTNEKLRALDETKDDFVSMASHQLRTPLTSIKGYTSMVLEGDAGKINATQRKLLEQSFTSSQRMVYLIADLLNVSRLKTGKFIIEQVPVNLAEVVQQEIGQLTEAAAGRSLTLTYEQPETFPDLLLDETKTRQVIMNFVDNAIYYTPAGGHITVKLVETPASVEFRVEDDGIGVPKNERQHLFTKFYRAGNARKARPDGTGLGLFMAKKVIVAEGGAIIFQSEEGKGSTFGFVFSKSKMAPSTPEAAPAIIAK